MFAATVATSWAAKVVLILSLTGTVCVHSVAAMLADVGSISTDPRADFPGLRSINVQGRPVAFFGKPMNQAASGQAPRGTGSSSTIGRLALASWMPGFSA
jgi:hypothetical protein